MLAPVRRAMLVVALLALGVPALSAAAPKSHRKPKVTPKPPPTEVTPTAQGSGDAKPAEPQPKPEPAKPVAPAPTTTLATPTSVGSGAASSGGAGAAPAEPAPSANEPDVDSLRQEYLALRDELFKSRARANAVASQLYSTRITVHFTWTSARFYGVTKAQVRLDGATVYETAGGAIAADDGVRFDGYVAPGRHVMTFHVEATGKDDDAFTSSTESQVVVKAVANKDLVVSAKGHDGGDIAYEWKRSERGSYGLGIDIAVSTIAHPAGPAGKPK